MVRVQQKARCRTTGSANNRPSPRNGFNGVYVLSPGTGFLAPVNSATRERCRRLSASTGTPGPHDLAVRMMLFVRAKITLQHHTPTASHPACRDDRDTPSHRG